MTEDELIDSDILGYLKKHETKELLRFVTVGSVDDGKSTLIGRLLYETKGVYEDQLASVKKVSESKGNVQEGIDFSLITDGLKSEREQGITIDVAYRYFSTEKRKFIIADTPGHVQYTRNMATGASTADVAIILIDARLGVLQQSRRHAYIASLLGIRNLLVAVNKMDLQEYNRDVFKRIKDEFSGFVEFLHFENLSFIPVSALKGDNIVRKSSHTDWYEGETVLHYLETVPIEQSFKPEEFYFPVQYVIRPDLHFRGFSGTLYSGEISTGDEIIVLPSGKSSQIKSIETYDGKLDRAFCTQAVTLTLKDEIDISRGDVLVKPDNPFHMSHRLRAHLVWMHEDGLKKGRPYSIKHAGNIYQGSFKSIEYKIDMDTLEKTETDTFGLNDIGEAVLAVNRPLVIDLYEKNRQAGSFIVIDRMSNLTVGAGMISGYEFDEQPDILTLSRRLTPEDRARHFSQKPVVIWFTGRPGSAKIIVSRALEKRLFEAGHLAYVLDPERVPHADRHATGKRLESILDYAEIMLDSGAITISAFTSPKPEDRRRVREKFGKENVIEIFSKVSMEVAKNRLAGLNRNPNNAELEYIDPKEWDIFIDSDHLHIQKAVDQILALLKQRSFI